MATVTLTKHVGETIERIRKNANKSDGPFRGKYIISGTIKADADFDAEGDVALSVNVPGTGTIDGDGGIEVDRTAQGEHRYTLEVETMNDDWVTMETGEPT